MNMKNLLGKTVIVFLIFLFTASAYAKTNVSEDELARDAVWTKASSPYEIEKDFYVRKGVTLTIEPGVQVIFKGNRKLEPTDANKRIKFVVNGRLVANGTNQERIVFTSAENLLGMWQGIIFENTEDNKSIIEYCQIERASCGIACFKSSPSISNSYFTKNELAIDCEDWSSPIIVNNTFVDNGASDSTIGVIHCTRFSSPQIKNNLMEKNVGACIHVSLFSSPEINQNIINYNAHGISINSFSQPIVMNNEIAFNGCFGQQGIAVNQSSPTIIGNYIHNNCRIGISVANDADPYISGNRITNNELGIICVNSSPIMVFNVIKDFTNGIVVGGDSLPTINYNDLQGGSNFSSFVKLENCNQQVNAQNNWWHTDKEAVIENGIIDGDDNSLLGKVIIKPYLESEIVLSDYLNINLEYMRKINTNRKYTQLKNNSIFFLSYRDGNWEIYTSDSQGKEIKNMTQNQASDISPAMSPDGQEIAFSSNRTGNHEIYAMKTDGTNIQQLTNNIFNDVLPIWSPDGKRIAYLSEIRHVFVINRDGSNKQLVPLETYAMSLPGFFLTSYLWLQNN